MTSLRGARHAQRHNIPWPQAWIGLDSPICAEYAVEGAPHYVLVGKDGKLIDSTDDQGKTALFHAAQNNRLAAAKTVQETSIDETSGVSDHA